MPPSTDGPSRHPTPPPQEGGSASARDAREHAQRARRIVHLDVDAFLASVEQACFPQLAGRPVVIGGMPHERNLVMSCSYEARAFGVRPGMRLSEAARRCPRAIFRRGDSQAANRLREETARVLMDFSPQVEVASIDDFFVDLGADAWRARSAFDTALAMRAAIRAGTRLPVTIGIGTSKTLARLAGKLAKPGGVAEVLPGYEQAFLGPLPVEHLPGVGHSIGALLERFAIRTVGDLRAVSREVLFASFGRLGLVLFQRARGIDTAPVEATWVAGPDGVLRPRAPASIRRDSTFEPEEGRRELIEAMLAYLVERAAERLRRHGTKARSLEVRIVYVDTRPRPERLPARAPREAQAEQADAPGGGSFAARRALAEPSDSTDELGRHARALLAALPRRRALVKRIGVSLDGLVARQGWQLRLFGEGDGDCARPARAPRGTRDDRHRSLDGVLDRLRARHGFGRILRGTSLPLTATTELGPDGFRLRTPSLNQ
jgi:DNA polymerase IV